MKFETFYWFPTLAIFLAVACVYYLFVNRESVDSLVLRVFFLIGMLSFWLFLVLGVASVVSGYFHDFELPRITVKTS